MPIYTYKCPQCGHFRSWNMIEKRNSCQCPTCENTVDRDFEYELNSGGGPEVVTDHPRWSVSMGVPVQQVEEFRKRYPGSTYDNQGRLLVKNRKDKLRQAEERGFVELS